MIRDGMFGKFDLEAAKILQDFLPDKLFDVHTHLYDREFAPIMCASGCWVDKKRRVYEDYVREMAPLFGSEREIRLNCITTPDKTMADPASGNRRKSTEFLVSELEMHPGMVGEIMVTPDDTVETLEAELIHPRIRGFKCYHLLAKAPVTWNCGIGEYLPESAWQVADRRHMCITLHMVKDKALADPENMEYIKTMAKRYPNAVLILAHCARGFAAWTAVETVNQLAGFDNVWFDMAAVCESPAMFRILQKTGTQRCMWGSDYPISNLAGKAISLGGAFYWINEKDINGFESGTSLQPWLIATENLMAVRQACIMAELGRKDIEDIFFNNAMRLFFEK